jgi:hypothetical protein
MLLHESHFTTYRNYRNVAETPIAKQRLMIMLLNIVFHLCCNVWPEGLHTGCIEALRRHQLLSNSL